MGFSCQSSKSACDSSAAIWSYVWAGLNMVIGDEHEEYGVGRSWFSRLLGGRVENRGRSNCGFSFVSASHIKFSSSASTCKSQIPFCVKKWSKVVQMGTSNVIGLKKCAAQETRCQRDGRIITKLTSNECRLEGRLDCFGCLIFETVRDERQFTLVEILKSMSKSEDRGFLGLLNFVFLSSYQTPT